MKRICFAACALLSVNACIIDDYGTSLVSDGNVCVSFRGQDGDTKSVLGDVEALHGGGVLGVYDAETGILDSEFEISDLSVPVELSLPARRNMDFYLAANMDYMGQDGRRQAFSFPERESDLPDLRYMLDGSEVPGAGGGLRHRTFRESSLLGIPMSGSKTGVDLSCTREIVIPVRRLFARITLTIDHSGLDGGKSESFFRNSKLYLRQANAALRPFAGESEALSEEDLLEECDYEPEMVNGRSEVFTLYAPENRNSPFPTYIEFTGEVDSAAGGYGGSVCYRFYVGPGAGDECDVEGNMNYDITLGFKVGSLFEPSWKVTPGNDWRDIRKFGLSADPAGAKPLPAGQVIAVRPSRPGTCYVYFDKGFGPEDAPGLCDGNFFPEDLTDAGWSYEIDGLSENGMSLAVSGKRLVVSVSDPSRFRNGAEIPLTLHLYPGDITYRAVIRTYDDISVSVEDGKSLDDGFYVGMKRHISLSGIAGRRLKCYNSGFADGRNLRFSSAEDAAPLQKSGAAGYGFDPGHGVDLFAWGTASGSDMVLNLISDDTFNDGDVLLSSPIKISAPIVSHDGYEVLYLGIDGSVRELTYKYLDSAGAEIDRMSFDTELYSRLLEPVASYGNVNGHPISDWVDSDGSGVWLKALTSSSGVSLMDCIDRSTGLIGKVNLKPKVAAAAAGETGAYVCALLPKFGGNVPMRVESEYFNVYGPSGIDCSWTVYMEGCTTFETWKQGPGSSSCSISVEPSPESEPRVVWGFSDPDDGISEDVPYGKQTAGIRFRNKWSGDTYELSTEFDVVHKATLGAFVDFTEGSRDVNRIIITTGKDAYGICCGYERTGTGEYEHLSGMPGDFRSYVKLTRMKTISPDSQTHSIVYGSASLTGGFTYEDFRPSAYGRNAVWSAVNIQDFVSSGGTPFSNMEFSLPEPGYQALPSPLPAAYSGCEYLKLSISNRLVGYHVWR